MINIGAVSLVFVCLCVVIIIGHALSGLLFQSRSIIIPCNNLNVS